MEKSVEFLSDKRLRFLILVVVCAYFVMASYWLFQGTIWDLQLTINYAKFQELTKVFWWTALFYSSELIGGSMAVIFRWFAGLCALYSAYLFLIKGENALALIKGKVCAALFFEGCYYLALIPSAIIGFVYPFLNENFWYFEPRAPALIVFLINGIACALMVLVIPPFIFVLRLKIVRGQPSREIVRWCCFTAVAYLFVVFWFNYSVAWVASLVPWLERAQPGISILYNPIDFVAFFITVFVLLFIAIFGLISMFPAITKDAGTLNLRHLGVVLVSFGSYFAIILVLFYLSGGYAAHPTVWSELLSPFHNPDVWCLSFIIPGSYLLVKHKN